MGSIAMQFSELKKKSDELKVLGETQETKLRYYENRAQNVAMAYLIWERLFVFGLSHTSSSISLSCTNRWMVLSFSLSCSSVYFLFFLDAVIMLYRAQNNLDMICDKQSQICKHILNVTNQPDDEAGDSISSDGLEFSFQVLLVHDQDHPFRIVGRKVYFGSIVSALLAVTAFELYMCNYLLCN